MKLRHWLILLALTLPGGAVYLLIEIGTESFSAPFVAWSRPTVASLTIAIVMVVAARRSRQLQATKKDIRARPFQALKFGLFRFALPMTLLAVGQLVVPSHLAGILVGTIALFAALMTPFLDKTERLSGFRLTGLVVGFAGVVLVVGYESIGTFNEFLGAFAILGAAASWAYSVFIAKRSYSGIPALQSTLTAAVTGSLLTLPLALATFPTTPPSLRAVIALLVLGTLATALGFWLLDRLTKEIGVGKATVGSYLLPVAALFYGAVFNSEPITLQAIEGVALVLVGVSLASLKTDRTSITSYSLETKA